MNLRGGRGICALEPARSRHLEQVSNVCTKRLKRLGFLLTSSREERDMIQSPRLGVNLHRQAGGLRPVQTVGAYAGHVPAPPAHAAQGRLAAGPVESLTCDLSEGEAVGLHAGVEEFDFEGSILNAAPLADQLVEPLIIRGSLALAVDVGSLGCANSLAVDKDAKPHGRGAFGRSHDEVDVTGMKAKGDTPVRLV